MKAAIDRESVPMLGPGFGFRHGGPTACIGSITGSRPQRSTSA